MDAGATERMAARRNRVRLRHQPQADRALCQTGQVSDRSCGSGGGLLLLFLIPLVLLRSCGSRRPALRATLPGPRPKVHRLRLLRPINALHPGRQWTAGRGPEARHIPCGERLLVLARRGSGQVGVLAPRHRGTSHGRTQSAYVGPCDHARFDRCPRGNGVSWCLCRRQILWIPGCHLIRGRASIDMQLSCREAVPVPLLPFCAPGGGACGPRRRAHARTRSGRWTSPGRCRPPAAGRGWGGAVGA